MSDLPEVKPERKFLDVKSFRELGYLQELNRQFLHPLGLALEVVLEDDGTESLGRIWDSREDPEGFIFGDDGPDPVKTKRIEGLMSEAYHQRKKRLGFYIQDPASE